MRGNPFDAAPSATTGSGLAHRNAKADRASDIMAQNPFESTSSSPAGLDASPVTNGVVRGSG